MHAAPLIDQYHAAIRRALSPTMPVTVLHIGAEHTVVITGAKVPVTRTLAIGTARTTRDWLRHSPPTPLEMERAIAAVEEEVMPLRAIVPNGSVLYTPDAALHDIVTAGLTAPQDGPGVALSIDEVEHLFSRLAAVSAGRPASQEQLPLDGAFYARMLILREFMHHLGFASVRLRAELQVPDGSDTARAGSDRA